jgi:uncharacterized protein YhaN
MYADRIGGIDEILAGEDRHRERIEARIREADGAIEGLLADAGAESRSEFFRRSEVFGKRQALIAELSRIPSDPPLSDDPALAGLTAADPDALAASTAELEKARAEYEAARTHMGRLEERISTLSRSEERSRARTRQASIVAEVDEAAEKWAILTLCQTLLEETRKVYESDRQPEVLRLASECFERMSGGRWRRVIAPLGSDGLEVESAAGNRISPEYLSRGTAEQLYLSMRMALVGEYSNHVEALPVIFDDIFVNFDPARTRNAIEAVRDLARTHQVLLFTCHPHLVDWVGGVVPDAPVHVL